MSRVGKKPISIPAGVTVTINDKDLEVKGPKGTLTSPIPAGITFKMEDGQLVAERTSDKDSAFHGLGRALANNCIVGVTEGFTKQMDVVGVGLRWAIHIRSSIRYHKELQQHLKELRPKQRLININ
jgi:large subunit ribosomal protein L6